MSGSFIISDTDVKQLSDIQVAFKVNRSGSVEILQVESYNQFFQSYLYVNMDEMPVSYLATLQKICSEWFVSTQWKREKQYNNDDPDFAA